MCHRCRSLLFLIVFLVVLLVVMTLYISLIALSKDYSPDEQLETVWSCEQEYFYFEVDGNGYCSGGLCTDKERLIEIDFGYGAFDVYINIMFEDGQQDDYLHLYYIAMPSSFYLIDLSEKPYFNKRILKVERVV